MTQVENGMLRIIWNDLDAMLSATAEKREELVKSVKDRLEQIAETIKSKDDEIKKLKASFDITKMALDTERQVSRTLTNLIKDIVRGTE